MTHTLNLDQLTANIVPDFSLPPLLVRHVVTLLLHVDRGCPFCGIREDVKGE